MPNNDTDPFPGPYRSVFTTLSHGAAVGFTAAFAASLGYWVLLTILIVIDYIIALKPYNPPLSDELNYWPYAWCAVMIVVLLPGMVAGMIVAGLLYHVWGRRRVTSEFGARVGACVGFLIGSIIWPAIWITTSDFVWEPRDSRDWIHFEEAFTTFLLPGLVGALAGAWHGRQMARWLRQGQAC